MGAVYAAPWLAIWVVVLSSAVVLVWQKLKRKKADNSTILCRGSNPAMVLIRPAEFSDVAAIAKCHIAAWRDSYRPVLADKLLSNLSANDPVARWNQNLHRSACHTIVAESTNGELVGFMHGGPERTGRTDYVGELYGVYLLKQVRRQGIGWELFQRFSKALAQDQRTSLIVWAFEGNECRAAYSAWGGKEVERGPISVGDQDLIEVAYGWTDITIFTYNRPNAAAGF